TCPCRPRTAAGPARRVPALCRTRRSGRPGDGTVCGPHAERGSGPADRRRCGCPAPCATVRPAGGPRPEGTRSGCRAHRAWAENTGARPRWPGAPRVERTGGLLVAVVGRLTRDVHVVRVALLHARHGDADEAGLLQGAHVRGTAITHAGTQAAHQLVHHLGQGAFVRHPTADTLGHQLADVVLHVLEVAVLAAVLHGLDAAHAAVGLEATAFVDDGLPGAFLHAGEHASH